jgi:hypothetical protein
MVLLENWVSSALNRPSWAMINLAKTLSNVKVLGRFGLKTNAGRKYLRTCWFFFEVLPVGLELGQFAFPSVWLK